MNEKEIREEFVKLFGEEKLKEEDLIQKLQEFANYICEEWLGLPSVPVVFDDLAKTSEASFNIELGVVLLNKKNKDHILKLLKSTLFNKFTSRILTVLKCKQKAKLSSADAATIAT